MKARQSFRRNDCRFERLQSGRHDARVTAGSTQSRTFMIPLADVAVCMRRVIVTQVASLAER